MACIAKLDTKTPEFLCTSQVPWEAHSHCTERPCPWLTGQTSVAEVGSGHISCPRASTLEPWPHARQRGNDAARQAPALGTQPVKIHVHVYVCVCVCGA